MVGRCAVNKGACFLTFSLILLTVLLVDNLTSSNSTKFADSNHDDLGSYGIIIDAGSTGSRLFLYFWTSFSWDELIKIRSVTDDSGKPVVKKVTPGLSSFADHPEAASDYIRPLLDFAEDYIPKEKHHATSVFIFATAGMRLLPAEKQEGVMRNLRTELPRMTKLQVLAQNIQVISGKWEGIYSWIAVNYMLGRFNFSQQTASPDTSRALTTGWRQKTAGMIDMGGASAQIAFEIPFITDGADGSSANSGASIQNVQLVNLGCRDEDQRFRYRLFVTTFLGFGVNEGAKKYEKLLWKRLNNETQENSSHKVINTNKSPIPYISDGCLPSNMLKLVYIEEDNSQFVRKGNGDWDSCVRDIASLLFDGYSKCSSPSCFFGGIQAPSRVSLSKVELYGFSEYWFSVEDVLSLGGKYEHDEFEEKAKGFCKQSWKKIKEKVKARLYPKADSERLETQCFKSAWIHAILHNGFHVDEMHHHFQSAFRINNQEVQWALGALIYQMRYFPLLAENQRQNAGKETLGLNLRSSRYNGWTFFYALSILAVLALLMRMYYNSKHNKRLYTIKKNKTGNSIRYCKLLNGQQVADSTLTI